MMFKTSTTTGRRRMKTKLFGFLAGVAYLFLVLGLGISLVSQWQGFYDFQFKKNATVQETGLSMKDLHKRGQALRIYLEKGDDDLISPYFNQREVSHMEDVHGLFVLKNRIMVLAGLAFLALFIYGHKKNFLRDYFTGNWILLLALIGFFTYIGMNFDQSFIRFHELFFDNDLWLLDPKTDVMIQMLPQVFFEQMAGLIGLFVLGMEGVYFFSLWKIKRRS